MTSPNKGIRHWAAKRISLRAIFSASTDTEVVKHVVPDMNEEDYSEKVRRITQMYKQWEKRVPTKSGTGPKHFFDLLTICCSTEGKITGQSLIDGDICNFLACFAEKDRKMALAALNDPGRPHGLTHEELLGVNKRFNFFPDFENAEIKKIVGHLNNHFPVMHSTHNSTQTVRMAIETGHLGSEHFYLNPDAAANWLELIDSEGYPSYQDCLEGLKKLFNGEAWRNIIKKGEHASVVMLGGGGAPSKDLLFIENILSLLPKKSRPLRYALVDLSTPLLVDSNRFLLREMRRHKWTNMELAVDSIEHDFLKLDGCAELLAGRGSQIWACTGGTIGNVRENAFFNSLNTRATSGDILLLTADTFRGESRETFREKILSKYENNEMRNFLSSPLGTVLQLKRSSEALGRALKRVKIDVDDEEEDFKRSDVAGSRYVEFSIMLKKHTKPIILLNSTRYNEQCLVDHAHSYGWRHIETASSPSNECFKQFLFRRS
jgi:hypothetical protein